MRRLCLFAGYSHAGRIDDHVVHYVRELSKFADVYYQAANDMVDGELEKLGTITLGSWAEAHAKYDFGSWEKLFFRIGWQEVQNYDVVILANDSNYGPVSDLGAIFSRMDTEEVDAWGITENYGVTRHMQSYFFCFGRAVFEGSFFREFFESIAVEGSKRDICLKYEIGLSKLLTDKGIAFSTFIDRSTLDVPFGADVSTFQNTLLRCGSPFLKRKVFSEHGFASEDVAETRALLEGLGYPMEDIPEPVAPRPVPGATEAGPRAEQPSAAADAAGVTVLPQTVPRRVGVRKAIKRILRPLYGPIKTRVVDRLSRIDDRVGRLVEKTSNIEGDVEFLKSRHGARVTELQSLGASINDLLNIAATLQGEISGISRKVGAVAGEVADIRNMISPASESDTSSVARQFASLVLPQLGDSESRLKDLQTSVIELHGHLDWTQRDILIALMSGIDFSSSKGFVCKTDHPVAWDSPDHLHPVGTVADHTRHPRFVRACEDFFGAGKQLSFLDVGCSAGGIVLDAVLRGHVGIGLEGSDISRLQQRAEWRLLKESLFTCDVTRPFELLKDGTGPFRFDVISAWEVLEHLTADGVDGMFSNLARHTHSGSVFACSISQVGGGFTDDGVPLHQTLEPMPWWTERASKHGFELLDSDAFSRLDFARGNGNPSIYYRPAHSYREKEGDCVLAVFKRR